MITQVNLPSDLAQRYDDLARHMGWQPEDVLRAALEAYLIQIDDEDARLESAIAEADRGDVVDAEQVDAENEAFLFQRGVTPERLAAIAEEVRRETEHAYGVSLCE